MIAPLPAQTPAGKSRAAASKMEDLQSASLMDNPAAGQLAHEISLFGLG